MIDEFYCFLMNFTHSNLLISITFAEELRREVVQVIVL